MCRALEENVDGELQRVIEDARDSSRQRRRRAPSHIGKGRPNRFFADIAAGHVAVGLRLEMVGGTGVVRGFRPQSWGLDGIRAFAVPRWPDLAGPMKPGWPTLFVNPY